MLMALTATILRGNVKVSRSKAILTDSHLWLPIAVLIFGISLLIVLR
jgi:hypothetical protein